MNTIRIESAALVLRSALGIALIAHGLLKFLVFTLPGTAGFFESVGFPGWAAYLVAPAEVALGALILVGYQSTIAAIISMPVLIGAALVHSGNGWLFTNKNGGWEYPLMLIALAAAVALLGDGAYSLRRTKLVAS
jgi:putative oxidoreductase